MKKKNKVTTELKIKTKVNTMPFKELVQRLDKAHEREYKLDNLVNVYAEFHQKTDKTPQNMTVSGWKENRLLHAAMGLCTESAEILDLFKKQYYGKQVAYTQQQVVDELGDLLWYVFTLLKGANISLEEVLQFNINKLKERYNVKQ